MSATSALKENLNMNLTRRSKPKVALPPRRIYPAPRAVIEPHAHQHVFKPRLLVVSGGVSR